MERPALGERELDILRFVAERAPVTARAVAEHFESEFGLARTTVVTLLERLRKKEYLKRRRKQGVFHYSPQVAEGEVARGLVRHFIEKTLGGSVSPVFAYLASERRLSDAELAELERWVETLREPEGEGR